MNTAQSKGGVRPLPSEFSEYYDATQRLQDKDKLTKLSILDLNEHDLVLVEAKIHRYARKGAEQAGRAAGRGPRPPLDKWISYYDLQAIYLLNAAAGKVILVIQIINVHTSPIKRPTRGIFQRLLWISRVKF